MCHDRGYQPLEFQLYLISAAWEGNRRHLGPHALEPARRSRVCVVGVTALAALEIFCQSDSIVVGSIPSPRCHRRHCGGEPGLSHPVCDRVRLFAMDFELGGLHAPDAACGEKPAQHKACPADIPEGPKDRHSRLDRYACPARRDRKTILILVLTGFLQANPCPFRIKSRASLRSETPWRFRFSIA
jgi:hypothetical protein